MWTQLSLHLHEQIMWLPVLVGLSTDHSLFLQSVLHHTYACCCCCCLLAIFLVTDTKGNRLVHSINLGPGKGYGRSRRDLHNYTAIVIMHMYTNWLMQAVLPTFLQLT